MYEFKSNQIKLNDILSKNQKFKLYKDLKLVINETDFHFNSSNFVLKIKWEIL